MMKLLFLIGSICNMLMAVIPVAQAITVPYEKVDFKLLKFPDKFIAVAKPSQKHPVTMILMIKNHNNKPIVLYRGDIDVCVFDSEKKLLETGLCSDLFFVKKEDFIIVPADSELSVQLDCNVEWYQNGTAMCLLGKRAISEGQYWEVDNLKAGKEYAIALKYKRKPELAHYSKYLSDPGLAQYFYAREAHSPRVRFKVESTF